MRGIVWGLTFDAAKEKLEEIEQDYARYQTATLIRKVEMKHECRLEYDNGDVWRAVSAAERCRGMRCNIAYIDARIDQDIIQCVIKPCTIAGPYHAINYFYLD